MWYTNSNIGLEKIRLTMLGFLYLLFGLHRWVQVVDLVLLEIAQAVVYVEASVLEHLV